MSASALRMSCQAMNAPSAPSPTMAGLSWSVTVGASWTPFATQPAAVAEAAITRSA
jgi:hypothetical protein